MSRLIKRILLFVIFCLTGISQIRIEKRRLGTYHLRLSESLAANGRAGTLRSRDLFLKIRPTRTDLDLLDPVTNELYTIRPELHQISPDRFIIELATLGAISPTTPEPATLNMQFEGRSLSGTGKVSNKDVRVTAIKLPTAWQCDHKNPTHIATSEEEMRSLTKQHMCRGWHKF